MTQRPNKKTNTVPMTVGSFFLRFLIWLFTTLLILLIGISVFFYITFKGPSSLAADEMAKKLYSSEFLSFIPELYSYKTLDNSQKNTPTDSSNGSHNNTADDSSNKSLNDTKNDSPSESLYDISDISSNELSKEVSNAAN